MWDIRWRHDGRQPIIPILILAPAPATDLGGVRVDALLDTGSTTSGITKGVATNLGLVGRGKRPLVSARNDDQVERYLFRIALQPDDEQGGPPSFPFVFEESIGFELRNGFRFEALIGMDVIRQCDLSMARSGNCQLRFG